MHSRLRAGQSRRQARASAICFDFPGRLERLQRTRWQWFSMVALLLVLRLQAGLPLVLEVIVAVEFVIFMALPARAKTTDARKEEGMRQLWEVADFVRAMRRQVRFGEISRAPLRLLRVELRGDTSWNATGSARPPDAWDSSLQRPVRDRNESQQVLAGRDRRARPRV